MGLLGVELSGSGLEFISAKAVHRNGVRSAEIVVPHETAADLARVWAKERGYECQIRIATEAELAEWQRDQELW